ncbi:MAG: Fic family protein [Candidatus Roizmanbacteria bacterium]|nr:Fic family protein [Candidatus Roizmanbacteria bacterium]
MIELLGKIEATRQYLKSLNVSPILNKKIQRVSLLKSSLFSAKIEGNPLTLEDYHGPSNKTNRREVENILKMLEFVEKSKIHTLDRESIKMLHAIAMENIHSEAGAFRHEMSAIFNQAGVAVYVCPPPNQIRELINKLLEYVHSKGEQFPLIKAFIAHLLFEKIHPFLDGNGRVGRLMIDLICKKEHYQFYPHVSFEEYLNEHKEEYYHYLDTGIKKPNEYLLFMLDAYFNQAEKLKKEIEQEMSKTIQVFLPPRQEEILQIVKEHKMVSFDFIRRRFLKVPPRTLRYDLKKICDKNLVQKIGQTRGSYYRFVNSTGV